MKKEEIERINKIADKLSIEFKVSDEDSANPAVKGTNTKVLIYAGHKFSHEIGEHEQQLYTAIELSGYDIEDLYKDAAQWLLSKIFYTHFKRIA